MSLFCEYYRPGRTAYDPECIAGNLCRCTGYRPIADVARTLPHPDANDRWLDVLAETDLGGAGGAQRNPRFARPTSLEGLFQAFADYPGARVIAGGTDLMVSANRRQERWPALIAVDAVAELQQFTWKDDEIVLGAGLSLASIDELVGRDHRGELALLEEVFPLFSSRLIRHRATLGGNLANASPVGDASPALLALGASLMLSSLRGERQVALGDFFAGYRRTVLEPGEIIVAIRVPRPLPRWQRFYKVSKRVQDDISTVAAGFALDLDGDRVARLRVAYGGVAATPLCAVAVERCAIGRRWDESTLRDLVGALDGVGTPQSDLRGSAAYRGAIMRKLLERFFVETRVSSDGAT